MSNSDLVLKQTYRNMLSLSNNIESFSNNTLFLGHLSIASNLYISGLSNIIGDSSFISNLNISNTSNINNITTFGNFYISATSNLYNLSINSTLLANNTTLINNTNILGNLNISNNAIINNITVNNNLYVSNISLLNKTTINSTLQATNALLNLNSSVNSNLYVSNISYLINLTSNSNLYVSNNTILQNNVNSNNLYTLNLNINQNMTNLSDIEISGNSYFNKDITVYKNMTVSNTLLISGLSTFNNLNITGTTTTILPEYSDNLTASNANVPLWGFYRTGGILKIRIDTLAPVMSGNTSISIFKGSVLTDPGVSVIDNLNEIIIPNITSINYSGYNYLSSPIPISGPMAITSFNSLLVGYHTITYTASDSYSNMSNIYRTVSVITSPSVLNISLNGSDVVKMKVGTTYTEQNVILNSNIIIPTNITGTVNNNIIGKYVLSYLTIDIFGNISNTLYRTVYVLDTLTINAYNITNSYLYLANNYNILTTSLFWTIEGWFNITSLSNNGCTIIDFREKPFSSNTGKIAFLINGSGYLGMYYESTLTFTSITTIPLNTWNHIAIQKNGIYFEFYLNGTFVGQIAFSGTLSNFNQLTLGMKNDLSNTDVNYHFKGSISQVKITPYLVYLTSFYPSYNLSSSNAIFFLGDNLKDTITNTTLTYNNIPTNILREYFVNLPVSNLESRSLVFNLECKNLIVSNVSPTSLTWTDSTNNYQFICHPNANTVSSLSKIQNNNGWKRTNNIAWTMSDTSNTLFKSLNWTFGISLEQWIYIDYDFVPSSTHMLLVGSSSMFNTNDYGFCFTSSSFPYNVLSFATSSVITNQGNGMGAINFRALVGKWTHLCATINSTNKILKLYVNGGLLISLDSSNWTVWCDPASSTSKFTIGCNSNNGTIQSESLNKVHFGNTRVYNLILDQDEVYNNYSYESSLYQITNGITYNSPISWSFNGGTSTIYTNEYIQTFNIETNKYIFKNYSVNTNSVYKISFNAKLITATNLCISITNSSGTFNTVGGYQMTSINSGLNTNNFIKFEYIFETKSLSSVNIYIGNHNQSDIGSQSLGTFSIFDFNLNIYNIIPSDVLTLSNIATPIDWVRPDGVSTPIINNDNLTTLYLDNKAYYTTLSLTPNTAYIISFWIKFGTATNFCIALINGATWNIGGYEGTGIKNGINVNTFTLVSYIFDSKNYTSLNLYIGQHSNSMTAQTIGTVIIGDFKILPITINSNISVYNPISSIHFIKSPNTIASDPITIYDFTTGWLTQSIDFNILRLVQSWTIEVWVYATSWGVASDSGYIFDFSSGSNSFILGITSSVSNISPTISYDGIGRPFIYYNGDTIAQWKIKSSSSVSLNQWNHIVYQKNNDTQLEMYVNGVSLGTFTISLNDWRYPNFMSSVGLNNVMIGASVAGPSSSANHWKGRLSQPKITLGRKYTNTFNQLFDLSVADNGLFLLQDNFTNNAIGKSMINNSNVSIPSYSAPTISILGNNPYQLLKLNSYNESGYYYNYYTRTQKLNINVNSNLDNNTIGTYYTTYSIYDYLNSINYVKRKIIVVDDNIPPVITLNGDSYIEIYYNQTYTEFGISVSDNSGASCTTNITSIIKNNIELLSLPININDISSYILTDTNYTYIITYSATDPSSNISTKTRTLVVTTPNLIFTPRVALTSDYPIIKNNGECGGWRDFAYGNGKYIIISTKQVILNTNNTWSEPLNIIYSTDKINWTSLDITPFLTPVKTYITNIGWYPYIEYYCISITYGNGKWYLYLIYLYNWDRYFTFCLNSSDGLTWSFNSNSVLFSERSCVKYVQNAFFKVDAYGQFYPNSYLSRSLDCITWTSVSQINPTAHNNYGVFIWKTPIYGNNMFITISSFYYNPYQFTNYLTSSDGITWTSRNFPELLLHPYIIFGNNKFFLYSNTTTYSSSNGINWTREQNSIGLTNNFGSTVMGYAKNTFFSFMSNVNTGTGTNYNIIFSTSSDGIIWTRSTLPFNIYSFINTVKPERVYVYFYYEGIMRVGNNVDNDTFILGPYWNGDSRGPNAQNIYNVVTSMLSAYNGQFTPFLIS